MIVTSGRIRKLARTLNGQVRK